MTRTEDCGLEAIGRGQTLAAKAPHADAMVTFDQRLSAFIRVPRTTPIAYFPLMNIEKPLKWCEVQDDPRVAASVSMPQGSGHRPS